MAVVCLLTPGQPSTNPRLVKEADALVEAGHEVHVVCAHWAAWADETDKLLLGSRKFKCTYVGGHPEKDSSVYGLTRLRHRLGRELMRLPIPAYPPEWALCRVSPELQRAAGRIKADLYIAHNMGALPAALAAARRHGAKLGFDAEDFHSGMSPKSGPQSPESLLVERLERQILPHCDYVTAAAPLIAERYAAKYGITTPVTILNVFSLSERPAFHSQSEPRSPLSLYWFSQTVGAGRGLEDIIRAMGRLRECHIILNIRGEQQRGYQEALRNLAAEQRLAPEQLVFLPAAPPDEMVRLSSSFDVGLALEPGRDENNKIALSNKLFTYLLAGNAIGATATEGQQQLLDNVEGSGFCYQSGDVDEVARRLHHWYRDRTALNSARRCSWNYGTQKFNWDAEKSKFLRVIENVLGLPAKQAA